MNLWPRFRIYRQSVYGVVTTYNIKLKFAGSVKVQLPVTGGQLHVLQYLEIHVSMPQFEEILCKIKYLYVNVVTL